MNPAGLIYDNSFLDVNDQACVWQWLNTLQWNPVPNRMNNVGANPRYSHHFGYQYPYSGGRNLAAFQKPATPFPQILTLIKERVEQLLLTKYNTVYTFNQAILNLYPVGQKISAHTDSEHYGSIICSISFYPPGVNTNGAKMIFKTLDARILPLTYEHFTPPGSLYIMSGVSRYQYTHEMLPTDNIRVSITFRTLLHPPS